MDDMISRQHAIDTIEREAYRHTYIDQIVDIIKNLPSAQPEPPTTAWLGNYSPYTCEHCGYHVDSKTRYCPDCGRRAKNYEV